MLRKKVANQEYVDIHAPVLSSRNRVGQFGTIFRHTSEGNPSNWTEERPDPEVLCLWNELPMIDSLGRYGLVYFQHKTLYSGEEVFVPSVGF